MRKMQLTSVLAVSLLVVTPGLPVMDLATDGAAFANGNGNGGGGGGGGGGNGGGNDKAESKKADKAAGKSSKSAKSESKAKKPKAALAEGEVVVAKGKPAKDGELSPSELGKMNGAMNANINAVLAHIRNGQTTKGPVGLLAGLAVADAGEAAAEAKVTELEQLAADFDSLQATVEGAGFETVEEYLQAKQDGTLTEDQLALQGEIDGLITAVGGTDEAGLALAGTKPLPEDIEAAQEGADEAGDMVADAEQAIIDAWKKDGDATSLLTGLRDKLAPHAADIEAAVAETAEEEETAVLLPEEEDATLE
jgi:hypothetical protein